VPHGRGVARTAITTTLLAGDLPFVGSIFKARPTIVQEDDYVETMAGIAVNEGENGSSSVLVVNLPGRDRRMRRALTGRGAVNDTLIIPVVLEIFFASTAGDAIGAQDDYDAMVDVLEDLIRANPNMSAPASVWSAGEYTAGVTHDQDQPYSSEDGLTVLINGHVNFECWQWIAETVTPVTV
jgi:hypothetical protein